ncbi:hypothetical protein [Salarchaeum sp. JOR-1]|uniref:DUF7511 domain-containing protein n=1 Tax=Salarchaeum sp. JOR-1 TaxID=2599399 RepID=UPI0011985F04|nr:hypothetical protein [Salarchaeum sp. JOR-1]QDX41604.1 hypothetical protein FQU85_12070 [Salarchaeum sp. JOR-1]
MTHSTHPAGTGDAIPPLRAQTVRSTDGPARCTVSPADASDDERTTAWLTVNASVLRSLDEFR